MILRSNFADARPSILLHPVLFNPAERKTFWWHSNAMRRLFLLLLFVSSTGRQANAFTGDVRQTGLTAPRPAATRDEEVYSGDIGQAEESDSGVDFDWLSMSKSVFASPDDQRPVILFDGMCNLCNGGVNFALDNDSIGTCL